nr:putative ribonuclease H-like domain-containing protein [Tanacetum cinerariifolium]
MPAGFWGHRHMGMLEGGKVIKDDGWFGVHEDGLAWFKFKLKLAWYETLANYLLKNGFQRRKIDQTLFIKKEKGDILLVQVYVDDIIFGSTNKEPCKAFEKLMKDKFQMSSMGELTFFLGLQAKVSAVVYTLLLIEAQQHISNESPPLGVNTPRCDEDSLAFMKLMVFMCKEDCVEQIQLFNDVCCYLLCHRVGKGFSGVETPLFASILVQPQVSKEEDDVEVPAAPTPTSPTNEPSPPPQDPIATPPQAQPDPPLSPP